ncbi:MAG: phospholipid/glycerol acyltransferase [Aeromicrobium sp.]|nr:phospholipid/glycerol acyltransferase [Aeromicrobium sp.]
MTPPNLSPVKSDSPGGQRDPAYVASFLPFVRRVVKTWFRSEVRGLSTFPDGGALVVSNHSGGLFAMDAPVFAVDFWDRFGVERPLFVLGHDVLFRTPFADQLRRAGFVLATRDNALHLLRGGGVTMVFPGGDYDVYRPTAAANVIDFNGRTGYVRSALAADVPIVPIVSIGGQENQLFLARGHRLAQLVGLPKLLRTSYLPVSFGFPFGLSFVLPVNLPLPTKIVTQVLPPIDIRATFGDDPDVNEVDEHVRAVMQSALDELASHRRFPVLG